MTSKIDEHESDLPCENRGRKTKKSIRWIKTHKQLTCRSGTVIRLDAKQFLRDIAKLERSLSLVKKSLDTLRK